MALLQIEDLRTEIQLKNGVVHAVDGVSLHVDEGETLGIVGESGCGKTMTALSIMDLLPNGGHIAGGSIKLNGREITGLDPVEIRKVRGDEIGMIFQDPLSSLNPTHTVGQQIAEVVLLHREVSKKDAMDRAVEVLDLVGMPRARERVEEYPHQFSGGMRQRVMIAMALANDPKLLIADEPTTALDVTIQKQILELIDNLRQRLGMAVIMVTHDLGVIAGRADRVAVMYAGKVVETTDTPALYANPRHPYTEALFHALPEKSAETRERLYSIPGAPPDLVNPPAGCRFAPRCRYATDRCRTEPPVLAGETSAHVYRCFFPVGLLEKTVGGQLVVTEPAPPEETVSPETAVIGDVVLSAKNLVKDFPVTRGRCSARSARSAPWPTCRSTSARARRSASSASPAAARPRSAGCWSAWTSRRPARSSSAARTWPGRAAGSTGGSAGTSSTCSRTPTPRSTRGCGPARSCASR